MKIKINGMTCQHCAMTVLNATQPFASDQPKVDLLAGNVSFTPREGFDEQEYALAIDELGFEVAK